MIRVLIADDSPIIRSSLTKSVELVNDTTVVSYSACNGTDALEWLSGHFADVCVTDIRMPRMDGLTLIERINEHYPWMVCLVVSSYDEFEYAKQSILLHALDYILKPVDDQLLHQALERADEKVTGDRKAIAAQLLLKRLPHNRKQMELWLEHIHALKLETVPLMIVDTLDLLESWVEGRYYLLNALSSLWLYFAAEELGMGKLEEEWDEGKDLGLGEKVLLGDQLRFYFRLCAVRRLEEGAYMLLDIKRGGRDQSTGRLIRKIKQYVKEHCREDINLQDLADYVELNKSYISTLFKQETGLTIWSYIVSERMSSARDLLLNSNLKVYEISYQVGYEDLSYFSQLFKKHYGLTPLDYKKRMEQ